MNRYSIADLAVAMECTGATLRKQAEPYRVDTAGPADMTIAVDRERLMTAGEKYPHLTVDELEYLLTGADFSRTLLDFDGFCLHASAVALNNRAVLFSAPCGTGKSTHTALWQQHFGPDQALIINDDKPALRLAGGAFQVYGTPWAGKSGLNLNLKVPLQAVVFLAQAPENRIRRLSNKEAVKMLIFQSLRPNSDRARMGRLLALLDALLARTPVYHMGCTVSTDAVKMAYNAVVTSQCY